MTYHTDAEFLTRARGAYQVDGEVEFDDNAYVSRSTADQSDYDPHGAYVQAWVWVEFPEEEAQCQSALTPRVSCTRSIGHGGYHTAEDYSPSWEND